ncbi:hypothetical protein C807_02223 [Lachnospiraceae bacterium 28-4]|nr:hypothetical protein C807_02223 [Lachnospiraceae bacterium 28-4]
MANNDRVYLAYSGQLGEEFERTTKRRIEWILEQAKAYGQILDIGCSQGIVSLLLGEQGSKVKGIDIQPEAIEFAEGLLKNEYAHVGECVEFECIDFMLYESDVKYDCIIITEVLEHLEEPDKFLEKAVSFLEPSGKMIISVPFGVMDHPDHVSTFYLTNFYSLLQKYLHIYSFDFVERWMGITAGLMENSESDFQIDQDAIKAEESNFEILDRKMSQRIMSLYDNMCNANSKYKQSTANYSQLKLKMNEQEERYRNALKEKEEKYQEQIQKRREQEAKCKEQEAKCKEQEAKCKEQEAKCKEQEAKCKEQEAKCKEQEKLYKEQEAKCSEQEKLCKEQEEKYRKSLEEQYKDLASTVEFISELQRKVQRLDDQNRNLAADNEQYRLRLEKIESNFIWKAEIKVYRKLKAIKNKVSRG